MPNPLSVVVPVYNEKASLRDVVQQLLTLAELHEIVIVDDASTDGTEQVAERLAAEHASVRVLRQPRNQGKGAAVAAGIAVTRGDIVLIHDADGEYDAAEIPDVIRPILEGRADAVYGSRFLVRKAARVLYFYHYIANKVLTFLSNLLTNVNLSDLETGCKAFRGEIIRNMILTSKRFGVEIEVTAKLCKLQCALYEVPISYYGRTYEQGKKIRARDAFEAFWLIFRFNLFCSLKNSYRDLPERKLEARTAHEDRGPE